MPTFWQFPTVSMGLGHYLLSIARFNRYLIARGIISPEQEPRIVFGDGETDEPETLGAIKLAARENLTILLLLLTVIYSV